MSRAATCIFVVLVLGSTVVGQAVGGPCPTSNSTNQIIATLSPDLICLVPQIYGPGGMVGVNNNGPLASVVPVNINIGDFTKGFRSSSLATLAPLTTGIGTLLTRLPIPSPPSGFLFSFNPSLGVELQTAQNLGPIFGERAETIGKHKLYVGFSYQYFDFDSVDGVNLRSFGTVFRQGFTPCPNGEPNNPDFFTCYNNGTASLLLIGKDFISTQNRIDLKVHQFTAVATFGITNRFDLSLAIPILGVHMDMSSDATIQNIELTDATISPACCVHQFSASPLQTGETLGSGIPLGPGFPGAEQFEQALFRRSSSATGIGDVIMRGKLQVLRAEKIGLAVGVDVHAPTGDELNFLGSGTWGIRPFVTFSRAGRVSPRASLGMQINGNSILGGNITDDTKGHLPNIIDYAAGVDVGITRQLSISSDFLGITLPNEKKVSEAPAVADFTGFFHPDISTSTVTSNQASIAVGGKFSPIAQLLISASVLVRLNDAGLHFKPSPVVGVSYKF